MFDGNYDHFFSYLQIPSETDELDLSDNSISFLPDAAFTSAITLTALDLSNNGLSELDINAFQGLASLRTLNLSHNNLKGTVFYGLYHIL